METVTALQLAAKAAELTLLCTTFQARYGRRYTFTPDSPAEAYALHHAINDNQAAMAALLDEDTLANPMKKAAEWWRWQATMDMATAGELAREINHLIASCAYFDASPCDSGRSPTVTAAQEAIAGMLHPDVRIRMLVPAR